MKKKGLLLLLLLGMAILSDVMKEGELKNGYIEREEIDGEEKELHLQLEMEGVDRSYDYSLEVFPVAPTYDKAEEYLKNAIVEIEKDFGKIEDIVPIKHEYQEGVVQADWRFVPFGLISSEGEIDIEKLKEQETIIQAEVELSCGAYEKVHSFSFVLEKPVPSSEESVLLSVEEWLKQEMEKEGSKKVFLPEEVNGVSLKWSEEKEYVTPKVVVLELVSLLLIWIGSKRKRQEEVKKWIAAMEREYQDLVNQLALLIGAGMTTRQAWQRISAQYSFKRSAKMVEEKPVYESIMRMNRRLTEGESERVVYQKFIEEISVPCYRKLFRILQGNLEKGTKGIAVRLEEESKIAFEQRILQAKKMGEEASTRMMLPLMLMLMIVMGMVMLPAIIGFQI